MEQITSRHIVRASGTSRAHRADGPAVSAGLTRRQLIGAVLALGVCALADVAAGETGFSLDAALAPRTARADGSGFAGGVRTEMGCGGTRVITARYAVFLEDRLFPDGFAYEYLENLGDAWGVLNIYAAERQDYATYDEAAASSGGAGYPAYRVYCVPAGFSAEPFGGTYAVAQLGATPDGAYTVCIARPYGQGFVSDDARMAAPMAVDADPAARDLAERAAQTMRAHCSTDTVSSVVYGNDTFTVVTPWYTVEIPYNLFPNGWYHTYSDEVYDWSGDGSGAYMGRVLNVIPIADDTAAFSVCSVKNYDVQGEVAAVTLDAFDGAWEGWRVVAYRQADFSARTLDDELALLVPYTSLIHVTADPGANPPLL